MMRRMRVAPAPVAIVSSSSVPSLFCVCFYSAQLNLSTSMKYIAWVLAMRMIFHHLAGTPSPSPSAWKGHGNMENSSTDANVLLLQGLHEFS